MIRQPIRPRLIEIDWPEFGSGPRPAPASDEEHDRRLEAVRVAMAERGLTHLVIYGDREHFANLAYLSGLDPRFEEALLIVNQVAEPLLLVGNECEGYLGVSPLWRTGKLRIERFQPFSLPDQPRTESRRIREIFQDEGIGTTSSVGCIGWKLYPEEGPHAIDLPAYLVDSLRQLCSEEGVTNVVDLLIHPEYGLRTSCSAAEISLFEYTNGLVSESMKSMLFGLREGMQDHDLARLAGYNGEPQSCHMTVATRSTPGGGLSGPVGCEMRRGEPLSLNFCLRGANSCRAGWIASDHRDLPPAASGYIAGFAGPYFAAVAEWLRLLRIGVTGDELDLAIRSRLPYDVFGIYLNSGHLIHLDEWVSSPVFPGSSMRVRSGMVFQTDVIPFSPTFFSTRMEDGVAIANAELRRELQTLYPECYERCLARREFLERVIGFELSEEILPLSNIAGLVPPWFLNPRTVFTLRG